MEKTWDNEYELLMRRFQLGTRGKMFTFPAHSHVCFLIQAFPCSKQTSFLSRVHLVSFHPALVALGL